MYGLIHISFRSFVEESFGQIVWQKVAKQRNLTEDQFISMSGYADNITFGMISATASTIGISVDDLLERFGQYWIEYMYRGEYAAMMNFAGSDLVSFLSNINAVHEAVNQTLVGTVTPKFDLKQVSHKTLLLRYRSERAGLLPFVRGLLKGLFARFGVEGEIIPQKMGKGSIELKLTLR